MDVELTAARNPREQVYPTTVAHAGQPSSCYGSEGFPSQSLMLPR